MATVVEQTGTNLPNGLEESDPTSVAEKYAQEREKRIGRGLGQYVDLRQSTKLKSFLDDPWIDHGTPIDQVITDRDHRKVLIVGAGYGGIMFAVNLIKAGFSPEDIVLVDPAGGFGGTWYWNRYPGLMCDVEAYIYMPLLEEMQYMPKHKYASGEELRIYAESVARKYNLYASGLFQSNVETMLWDDNKHEWHIQICQTPKGMTSRRMNMSADFVILSTGPISNAKLPDATGIEDFEGKMFHTARWDYNVTGGSPEHQSLTKLRDKRVGIIGTGATAIQIVPRLAEWAKELCVFQRTPSAVASRDNHETDPATWTTDIASKPGWWKERNINYALFVSNANPKPPIDLVNDGWTSRPSMSALIGGPSYNVSPENAADHVSKMLALDGPVQEKVRRRTVNIVKDVETAKKLQAWYPVWCKRPCFHDEYLAAFNKPHVKLVDTDGKGIDKISRNGVIADGKEYGLDVIVWASGFLSPSVGTAASQAQIKVVGREGARLEEKFAEQGVSTLHGVISRGCPNFFWPGSSQGAFGPNYMFVLDTTSTHVAYIIAEASRRGGKKVVVEPTVQGEEQWTSRIVAGAAVFSSMSGCTPSYFNREGETDTMSVEEKTKAAKGSPWPKGIVDFRHVIEAWREENSLDGLEIRSCS